MSMLSTCSELTAAYLSFPLSPGITFLTVLVAFKGIRWLTDPRPRRLMLGNIRRAARVRARARALPKKKRRKAISAEMLAELRELDRITSSIPPIAPAPEKRRPRQRAVSEFVPPPALSHVAMIGSVRVVMPGPPIQWTQPARLERPARTPLRDGRVVREWERETAARWAREIAARRARAGAAVGDFFLCRRDGGVDLKIGTYGSRESAERALREEVLDNPGSVFFVVAKGMG